VPPGFPLPNVPEDNPMTKDKVELGRYLFYDKLLSLNQTQSCATCHRQELAFTDGRPRGVGSTGEVHPRGPMSLANVVYSPILTWANPLVRTLEAQALVPLSGEDPVELGMTGKEDVLLKRVRGEIRSRIWACICSPIRTWTSASSRRRRCATSPLLLLICTTRASKRWKRWSIIIAPEGGPLRRDRMPGLVRRTRIRASS